MNLEDDLRRALNRKPAPADFESRMHSRLQQERKAADAAPTVRRRPLAWLAAAAAVAAVAVGGAQYYEHQRNVAEARRIEAEIRLAMHVTNEALATVQVRLLQASQ